MGDDIQNPVNSRVTAGVSGESGATSRIRISEMEKAVRYLEETIKQRDTFIDKISKEKISIANENEIYLKEISQKNNEISELKNRNLVMENQLNKIIDDNNQELSRKEKVIVELQGKINELASAKGADQEVIRRLEELNVKHSSLREELIIKDQELVRMRSEYNASKYSLNELKKERDTLMEQYLKLQEEKNGLKQNLDVVNNKLNATFTSKQLSNYLTNAIDSFNKQVNASNNAVNYIINGMDVEFKATIAKDDANQMVLSAPDLASSSGEALSTIKFSIRAVPKTNN